jgi:hypothetical protein
MPSMLAGSIDRAIVQGAIYIYAESILVFDCPGRRGIHNFVSAVRHGGNIALTGRHILCWNDLIRYCVSPEWTSNVNTTKL